MCSFIFRVNVWFVHQTRTKTIWRGVMQILAFISCIKLNAYVQTKHTINLKHTRIIKKTFSFNNNLFSNSNLLYQQYDIVFVQFNRI